MPKVDRLANERKRGYDDLAASLLDLDEEKLEREAAGIAFDLLGAKIVRLCVTGGAGSGKTTSAAVIGERLNLPVFDFDEYVPGGFHEDGKIYRKRLLDGMDSLWNDLPIKTGWVIEHVESCNEDMLQSFRPTHCLLLKPATSHLLRVAEARSAVNGDSDVAKRGDRALRSSEYARVQFERVPGEVMKTGPGWELKKVGA